MRRTVDQIGAAVKEQVGLTLQDPVMMVQRPPVDSARGRLG